MPEVAIDKDGAGTPSPLETADGATHGTTPTPGIRESAVPTPSTSSDQSAAVSLQGGGVQPTRIVTIHPWDCECDYCTKPAEELK